ncbi:protein kinase domain-containing protein [Dokdonella sp. MW10]|uniref:serine/threonine-protein kinase n=1 Tax=Dokdonella sp. MW10 TaxID=2992926 RepID=UPI003F7F8212
MSRLRDLFDAVCDLPADARTEALRELGADEPTIAAVLDLVAADAVGAPARDPIARIVAPLVEAAAGEATLAAGSMLGAWRIVRELGRGGMGAVFLAERADGHFTQRAAIKLMRGFRDDDDARRFERERQLLADLDHPRIARLIDGGATKDGDPYLVMEYVDGEPLDAWAARQAAGDPARLALFTSICETVHHAHQRRVVHCDLKPSNVLVRADGVAVLLDFGIAQASDATAAPGDTAGVSASPRLTPRYASPEQLRGETPTVASDLFSLGVLLAELVSGTRIARERGSDVPAPSTLVATRAERRRLRGDLDAIVARACHADPTRRYASALALAEDVQRIARHQPVQARPPRWHYVLRRLARRRWPAFAAGLLVVATATGFGWRTVLAERAARAEALTAQRATDFLVSVFSASDSNVNSGVRHDLRARDVLDSGLARLRSELADEPATRARLLEALGHAYRHMSLGTTAVPLLREAVDLNLSPEVDDPAAAARCAEALVNAMANGAYPARDVVRAAREALVLAQRVHDDGTQPIANALMVLSLALNRAGRYTEALAAARATFEINRLERPGNRLASAYNNLALIHVRRGEYAEAGPFYEEALRRSPPDSVVKGMRLAARARLRERLGDAHAAEADAREAVRLVSAAQGDAGAFAIYFRTALARYLATQARFDEAFGLLERVREDQKALTGQDDGDYVDVLATIAAVQATAGHLDAARAGLRDVHARYVALYGEDDPVTLGAATELADALVAEGDAAGARALLAPVLAQWRELGEADAALSLRARIVDAGASLRLGDVAAATATLDSLATARASWSAADRLEIGRLRADLARQEGPAHALAADEASWRDHVQVHGEAHPRSARAALVWAADLRATGDTARADELETVWRPRLATLSPDDAASDAAVAP